jgi:aminoglycoside phosphotransferase family enzyme/predicted kinase
MAAQPKVPEFASVHPGVAETHISVLFFLGDRAYKWKKPVKFDFLDHSTRAARERACHREVELNRRIAPDVYEGVADVVGPDGQMSDHLVVMRRLPDERRLAQLVMARAADLDAELEAIAAVVADFHGRADRNETIDAAASPDALVLLWKTNVLELGEVALGVVAVERIDLANRLATTFLTRRSVLLRDRIDAGQICDGHGDLQAEDIFCEPDGPRILDCIDFDDRLRYGDVANDVAFLAMDLERLGAPAAARTFIESYERVTGRLLPRSLLDFYIAYRALVRSKIHCIRARAGLDPTSADTANSLVELAISHLSRTPVLFVVGGLPGTGKSTLAREIGRRFDAVVVNSDVIRKQLAGVSPDESHADQFERGMYSPDITHRVYEELLSIARRELEHGGRSVVLDASWRSRDDREAARALAGQTASPIFEACCELPHELAAERMRARVVAGRSVSDATAEIAEAMALSFDDWPEAVVVDTRASTEACADEIDALVADTISVVG